MQISTTEGHVQIPFLATHDGSLPSLQPTVLQTLHRPHCLQPQTHQTPQQIRTRPLPPASDLQISLVSQHLSKEEKEKSLFYVILISKRYTKFSSHNQTEVEVMISLLLIFSLKLVFPTCRVCHLHRISETPKSTDLARPCLLVLTFFAGCKHPHPQLF